MTPPASKPVEPKLGKRPALPKTARLRIEAHLSKHHPEVHVLGFLIALESAALFGRIDAAKNKKEPSEKARNRSMDKVRTASINLLAAIEKLDEDAKWHYFGCVESRRDIGILGVLDRRSAEAKGFKRGVYAQSLAKRLFEASTYPLPPLDKYSAQLQAAVAVRLTFEGVGIDFTARGFSKMCLEQTFKLAGMPTSSIAYWVSRSKAEAKNLP